MATDLLWSPCSLGLLLTPRTKLYDRGQLHSHVLSFGLRSAQQFKMSYSEILLSLPTNSSSVSLNPEKSLWSAFDTVFSHTAGYKAVEFRFVPGQTPMSTGWETALTLSSYYFAIFVGREIMRNRPALKLNGLFKIHNFLLTVASGTLLALFAEQLIPSILNHGLFNGICGADGWTRPLVTLYYVSEAADLEDVCADSVVAVQLHHQIHRAHRYGFFGPEEEALDLFAHLPPRRDRTPVLYAARGPYSRFLGAHNRQSFCSRGHVSRPPPRRNY